MGKISFTIERRVSGYYLNYVGGVSIPKVSGQPVRHSMKLEESDLIEIGPATLRFSGGSGIPRGSTGRRRSYRRKTDLPGSFNTPTGDMYWMIVVSLSKGGLRMQAFQTVDVKREDILKIEFTLDDEKQSRIDAEVVVRYISKEFIGCKFSSLGKRASKTLRSYLMP